MEKVESQPVKAVTLLTNELSAFSIFKEMMQITCDLYHRLIVIGLWYKW
jgi:hypothetical protein